MNTSALQTFHRKLCEASSVVEKKNKEEDTIYIFYTILLWHLHSQLKENCTPKS